MLYKATLDTVLVTVVSGTNLSAFSFPGSELNLGTEVGLRYLCMLDLQSPRRGSKDDREACRVLLRPPRPSHLSCCIHSAGRHVNATQKEEAGLEMQ